MPRQDVIDAIEGNDPAKLLRIVDGMCAARAWDDLVDLEALVRLSPAQHGKVDHGVYLGFGAVAAQYTPTVVVPAILLNGLTPETPSQG